ncbi:MAG TPA: winged helix-turn-helix domain-containing protein, partial [Tissierellaceae bacterium]
MLSPNLNENLEIPLYEQLYLYIKKQIKNNILKTNDKLPSKRSLSNHLGISINTVTNAYEMLIDEGYLYSIERTGYFISDIDNLVSIDIDKNNLILKDDSKNKYDYNLK